MPPLGGSVLEQQLGLDQFQYRLCDAFPAVGAELDERIRDRMRDVKKRITSRVAGFVENVLRVR